MTKQAPKPAATLAARPRSPGNRTCLSARLESPPKPRTRLLLADDHPVVRRGLVSCLAHHPRLEIVGEAADGQQALRLTRELAPDVVLMDIDMPHTNGLNVTEQLRKEMPEVKVLILSMSDNPEFVTRIIQSGARGYVPKEASPDDLVRAIETVCAGETCFSAEVARAALAQYLRGPDQGPDMASLTEREREVLIDIAKGLSNKEIACHLGVGTRTVETHRDSLMRRLDIHSVAGLTRFAISKGLISLREELKR